MSWYRIADTGVCLPHVAQVKQPYMVLLLALLAGDARAADAVTATLAQLQLPPVLSTIEDYMWAKLTLLLASQVIGIRGTCPPHPPLLWLIPEQKLHPDLWHLLWHT
jgi:hypothetical protein